MNSQWQIDLFTGLNSAENMPDVLDAAIKILKPLGFDYCSFRASLPLPLKQPKRIALQNIEDKVISKVENGEYDETPAYKHCSRSSDPFWWEGTTEDKVFAQIPEICEEHFSLKHRGGWSQSLIESKRLFSIFWADSADSFNSQYLVQISPKMEWIATAVLMKMNQVRHFSTIKLSEREKEVLRWTGDGKTASDIGMILNISHSTVNFHLRNAMFKLDAPNKTSAVVKAIYLNLLC